MRTLQAWLEYTSDVAHIGIVILIADLAYYFFANQNIELLSPHIPLLIVALTLIIIGIRRTRYDPSLFVAIATGDSEKSELKLNNGSNPNVFDLSGGLSPLHVAVLSGSSECANILLKHGADVDAADKGAVGGTSLNAAAEKGYVEIARLLIEHGANVDGRTKEGKTALMIAAANGSSELVELLIDKDADVNAADNAGFTALIGAAYNVKSDQDAFHVADTLIKHGADIDKSTLEGITPLFGAISGGNIDIVKLLIENGVNVNKCHPLDGTSPLMFPDGHFNFPHPWPGQIPPVPRQDRVGLLPGVRLLGKAARRFLQPIASAGELDEHGAVHQPIEDRRGQRRIA